MSKMNPTILMICDFSVSVMYYEIILRSFGIKVITANSLEEILNQINIYDPQIITVDNLSFEDAIKRWNISGSDVTGFIKPRFPEISLIAFPWDGKFEELHQAGCQGNWINIAVALSREFERLQIINQAKTPQEWLDFILNIIGDSYPQVKQI